MPVYRADHAQAIALFALEMVQRLEEIPARYGQRLTFQVGMNSGPLITGVIGRAKYQFDLWGDTVNIASRMASTGEAGKVHISQATYELLEEDFSFTGRGQIAIKGRGEMATWFLKGRRGPTPARI